MTILELLDDRLCSVDTLQMDVGEPQLNFDRSFCLQVRQVIRHLVVLVLQHRHEAEYRGGEGLRKRPGSFCECSHLCAGCPATAGGSKKDAGHRRTYGPRATRLTI